MPSNQAFAVVAATRLFTLLAVGAPALWLRDREAILAVLAFAVLWIYQVVAAIRRELRLGLSPAVEAAVTGVICALGMDNSTTLLAALVVPPMTATVYAGVRTMVRTVLFQVVAVVSFGLMWWQTITSDQGIGIFTWTVAGVGLSLVANYTFADQRKADQALAPYRDAQHLISQLIELSGNLTSGLDVTALSGEMLALVGDRVPHRGLVLFVPRGETLAPIASSTELEPATTDACQTVAMDTLTWGAPVYTGTMFAFRAGDTAVIAGVLPEGGSAVKPPVPELREALAPTLVKLDTALLFTQFRDSATADERQRLAREMHDGVAQDIASLGYLVDAIAARPADDQQAAQLRALREQVSKVVAEVRQSVLNLRTSMGEHESLGAAISAVARHLSEASGVPIRVRLDEQPARLRHEVEAELFRIAQEALNNAIKHARATSIDVHCEVYAPEAAITVTDDGVGLQRGRSDSHGLKIMRERAKLIGAQLTVRDNADGGLTVSVRLRSKPERRTPAPHRFNAWEVR